MCTSLQMIFSLNLSIIKINFRIRVQTACQFAGRIWNCRNVHSQTPTHGFADLIRKKLFRIDFRDEFEASDRAGTEPALTLYGLLNIRATHPCCLEQIVQM